jgi:hypothetical protein
MTLHVVKSKIKKVFGVPYLRNWVLERALKEAFPETAIQRKNLRRVAVFPRSGVIYNRIQKNANTTTMLILDRLETGNIRSIAASKGQNAIVIGAAIKGQLNLSGARSWLVTRNPYTRILSAFLYKFHFDGPAALRRYGRTFEISPRGFENFLLWLKDGGLERDGHWNLQVKSMALPAMAFTDIIRTEFYEDDLLAALKKVPAFSDADVASVDIKGLTKAGSPHGTSDIAKKVAFFSPRATSLVVELFHLDFLSFGYVTENPIDQN